MTQLKVCDETTAGEKTGEFVMDLLTERITVRELIRSRVYQEVQDYNLKVRDCARNRFRVLSRFSDPTPQDKEGCGRYLQAACG